MPLGHRTPIQRQRPPLGDELRRSQPSSQDNSSQRRQIPAVSTFCIEAHARRPAHFGIEACPGRDPRVRGLAVLAPVRGARRFGHPRKEPAPHLIRGRQLCFSRTPAADAPPRVDSRLALRRPLELRLPQSAPRSGRETPARSAPEPQSPRSRRASTSATRPTQSEPQPQWPRAVPTTLSTTTSSRPTIHTLRFATSAFVA